MPKQLMGLLEENHSLENISLFFFPVLLRFSTLITALQIGKSSFQVVTGYHHPSIYLN